MKVSVIVSTYNRPRALRLVLESLLRQSRPPEEVIVGDDGSGPETEEVVNEFRPAFGGRLIYIRQPDEGFRLSEIRNKSVAAASGDFIIQIDGDIIADRHFVEDYVRLARPGYYIKGTRIMLTPAYTRKLENKGRLPRIMPGFLSPGIAKNRLKALRLPYPGFRESPHYRTSGTGIGANMAFWRDDFLAVNGYDEGFKGWGCEDTDLMERFGMAKIGCFKTFHLAKAYHLYHPESKNPDYDAALARLEERISSGEKRIPNGVDKWLRQK